MVSIITRRNVAIAAVFVIPFSLLGLLRAMLDGYSRAFVDIWSANLWGDIMFAGGTVAAVLAVWAVARQLEGRATPVVAQYTILVPLAFALGWVVYSLAWMLTGNVLSAFITDETWASGHFFAMAVDGEAIIHSWNFVLQWGWPGIAAFALAVPAVAGQLARRDRAYDIVSQATAAD